MPDLRALVALDGSAKSEAALKFLPLLLPVGHLTVRLLAVVEAYSEAEGLKGAEAFIDRESKLLSAYLDKTAEGLRASLRVPVEAEVRTGAPDDEISASAKAADCNLIVLTTHGRSGISRWAIGSVADKVVRHAEVNTFVIGPEAEKRVPAAIKQILVPLDGSALADEALPTATAWARALGARLHLVRVVTIPPMSGEGAGIPVSPDLFDALQQAAQAHLDRTKATIEGVDVVTDNPIGPITDALLAYETANAIDLVVMTSHARRGLLRSVLGSVADRLLHGPAPVLMVRRA